MADLTARELYVLELINRARSDPGREASRLGIDLNENLTPGTISYDPKQPLAHNSALNDAATSHSIDMRVDGFFAHQNPNTFSNPAGRAAAAGYGSSFVGENIARRGTTAPHTDSVKDAQNQSAHDGLFKSSGHRTNLMREDYREIGLGNEFGPYTPSTTTFNGLHHTQLFGTDFSSSDRFITGVTYNDTDNSGLYSIGEGVSGINISFGAAGSTSVSAAGGYQAALASNTAHSISFTGTGVSGGSVSATFSIGTQNVKIDLINGDTLNTTVGLNLGSDAVSVKHMGLFGVTSTGNEHANTMQGGQANDTFFGQGGDDWLFGNEGDDQLNGGSGVDRLFGWSGNDTLRGGADFDIIHGQGGNDNIFGDDGGDQLHGGDGNDSVFGWSGADWLFGDAGDDRLFGQGGDDDLFGWSGNDQLFGDDGNDRLEGQDGEDLLLGWTGNDVLIGGRGRDLMDGQSGADNYEFLPDHLEAGVVDLVLAYDSADRFKISNVGVQSVSYHTFAEGAAIDVQLTGGGVFVIDVIGASIAQLQASVDLV